MKKAIIIAVCAASAATAYCYDTAYGNYALRDAYQSSDNGAFGDNAGRSISWANNNLFIGSSAGFAFHEGSGNIAIGRGALRSVGYVNGTVAIGENELMGADYNSDTTSINGMQLWISEPANAFSICPKKNDDFTNSVIYYVNGKLHLNAEEIVSNGGIIGGGSSFPVDGYDFYVSVNGYDTNSGTDWRHPKRTVEAVWRDAAQVADRTNFTCAVFAGTHYVSEAHTEQQTRLHGVYGYNDLYPKRVRFVAVEGSERTVLSADADNLDREDSAFINLSISLRDTYNGVKPDPDRGPSSGGTSGQYVWRVQTFEGFQVVNFGSCQGLNGGGSSMNVAPCFCGIDFIDCDIHDNFLWQSGTYGAVALCSFENCRIHDNILYHSGGSGTSKTYCYWNCSFKDTFLEEYGLSRPSGWDGIYSLFRYSVKAERSAFRFLSDDAHLSFIPSAQSGRCLVDSTFHFGSSNCNITASANIQTNNSVGCYFAMGDGRHASGSVWEATGNVAAPWTNAVLTAGMVAADVTCPAVRSDGRNDAGWKDSGLSARKMILGRADLRLENGEIAVYQNGVKIGVVSYTPTP